MEASASAIASVRSWVFLGCMFIFSTFRPGHFLLYEGEENLPRLWKNLQKELGQGLHTVRIKYRLGIPLP